MSNKLIIVACIAALGLSGCARVENKIEQYDRSKVYLKTDQFMAKRATVPGDLDSSNIEDYYVVPTIADQGDPKVPDLRPPQTKVVEKATKKDVT